MAAHDRPPWYVDFWLVATRAWINAGLEILSWPAAICGGENNNMSFKEPFGDKVCDGCEKAVTDDDWCYGCESFICEDCNVNDTLMGSHDVDEHYEEEPENE